MQFPSLYRVRQKFNDERISDIPAAVAAEIQSLDLAQRIQPGQTVAVTAGSRGIANISAVLRAVVDELKALGLQPFLVPAMGSHGGGTAEGQASVLKKYGIHEKSMSVPIKASMDIVTLGETTDGVKVVMDRMASEADWVVVVNRSKPHTKFDGVIESGLCKMILIGLGKAEGAKQYHRAAVQYSFDHLAETAVPVFMKEANVLFGMGIIENGYDQTARLQTTLPEKLVESDKAMLREAKNRMPRLPFDAFDVVVVDWIGKNFSGTGMDTNIVGYKSPVNVTRVYARGLHPSSEGNASGVGFASIVHRRLIDSMDVKATALNCLTALSFDAAKTPAIFETDRDALEMSLNTIGLKPPQEARLCWIPNTLHLEEVWLSDSLMDEVNAREDLAVLSGPHTIQFDPSNDFVPCPEMFSSNGN